MVRHLGGATLQADQAVGPLHLTGEDQLGDDGLDGDSLLEHDLDERFTDASQGRSHRLLDGQVEDGLLFGGEFDGSLAEPTDGLGHGQDTGPGRAGDVAVDPNRRDEADALEVAATDLGPEHPGRHHAGVAREVEPAEGQRVAAGHDDQGVGPGGKRQARDDVVGDEHADHVGVIRPFEVAGGEAIGLGGVPGLVGPDADDDVEARVAQVEGPRSALVAVPDDGDPLAGEGIELGV